MREKMDHVQRAKQFLPFNSLKGFYDLVLEAEKIKMPRRKITQDEAELINEKIVKLKIGMMVIITYYETDGYVKIQGVISFIDTVYKTIKIVDNVLQIKDIIDVEAL